MSSGWSLEDIWKVFEFEVGRHDFEKIAICDRVRDVITCIFAN